MSAAPVAQSVPVVRLFTREGCGLCDQAIEAVERELERACGAPRLAFSPCTCGPSSVVWRVEYPDGSLLQVIDVDAEPDLRTAFGFEVPVVEVEAGPTFKLQLDERAFSSAISEARSREAAA